MRRRTFVTLADEASSPGSRSTPPVSRRCRCFPAILRSFALRDRWPRPCSSPPRNANAANGRRIVATKGLGHGHQTEFEVGADNGGDDRSLWLRVYGHPRWKSGLRLPERRARAAARGRDARSGLTRAADGAGALG